jgi:hypothetical protein
MSSAAISPASNNNSSRSARRREAREIEAKRKEIIDSMTEYEIIDEDTGISMECFKSLCPHCISNFDETNISPDNIMNVTSFLWIDNDNFVCTMCLNYKATSPFMIKYVDNLMREMEKCQKYPDEMIPERLRYLRVLSA